MKFSPRSCILPAVWFVLNTKGEGGMARRQFFQLYFFRTFKTFVDFLLSLSPSSSWALHFYRLTVSGRSEGRFGEYVLLAGGKEWEREMKELYIRFGLNWTWGFCPLKLELWTHLYTVIITVVVVFMFFPFSLFCPFSSSSHVYHFSLCLSLSLSLKTCFRHRSEW